MQCCTNNLHVRNLKTDYDVENGTDRIVQEARNLFHSQKTENPSCGICFNAQSTV
jgi:hypothetical protein